MGVKHLTMLDATGQREFACFPAAVGAFVVDGEERILLLEHPKSPGHWQIVCGALEAKETLLDGIRRELREELGEQVRVRPLCLLHAYTFPFDAQVQQLLSVIWLMEYGGGEIVPSDDMAGANLRWVTLEEVEQQDLSIVVPSEQPWLFPRAIEMYRLLRDQPDVDLQPLFETRA